MAYVELHDGIIVNLSNLNVIQPITNKPSGNLEKRWNLSSGNQTVQITDGEYSTIKTILSDSLY